MTNYVTFKDKTTNMSRTRRGVAVGNHLAVVPGWQIYRVKKGIPAIPVKFPSQEDATKVAEWFNELYGNYFILWELGNIDIFAWAKWSVPNGLAIYEMWGMLPEHPTWEDIKRTIVQARIHIKSWKRKIGEKQ